MMSSSELAEHFKTLGLTLAEAAQLLDVSDRTVRRWLDGGQVVVPGPVEHAVRAWRQLHEQGDAWRPGEEPLSRVEPGRLARYRRNALGVDEIVRKVRQREGPTAPWDVRIDEGRATLGLMGLTFRSLGGDTFVPLSYQRSDRQIDALRDRPLLEDAYCCIADALSRQVEDYPMSLSLEPPRLLDDRVVLWDRTMTPPNAVVVPCAAVREAMNWGDRGTDQDCLRLVELNFKGIEELADLKYMLDEPEVHQSGLATYILDDPDELRKHLRRRMILGDIAKRDDDEF